MGKPVIHAVDHSPGGADPLKSWGADADDVLTSDGTGGVTWSPVATVGGGTGIHFGDNVGSGTGGWLNVTTNDDDGTAGTWGMNIINTVGNAQWYVQNGYLTLQAGNSTGYVTILGGTHVKIYSGNPTTGKVIIGDDLGNPMFEFRNDGTFHGLTGGSIVWDL